MKKLIAIAVLALLVSACGKNEEPSAPAGDQGTTTQPAQPATPEKKQE